MTRTKLTSGGTTGDGLVFTTEASSAPARSIIIVFVSSCRAGVFVPAPSAPIVRFGADVMLQVNTVATSERRLTCFQLVVDRQRSDVFTIDFSGEQQDFCAWSAVAFDDVDPAGPVSQSKVGITGTATTLAIDLSGTARNTTVGALILDNVANVAPGPGLTEIDQIDSNQGFFARNATLETVDGQPLVEDVSWTWDRAANAAALAVEIKAAPPATSGSPPSEHPHEALIRRFEPIVFLAPDEKFVPVNAERFVESATLWTTGDPPFDKTAWGEGPSGGGTFPRTPTATRLSTQPNDPGATFIGSVTDTTSAFLELGGWNSAALQHESEVTGTTENVYSDRDAVAVRYETDLKDSRFWYHAEVFLGDRLPSVAMAGHSAPDLRPLLTMVPNAALLCYYFFFPAHQQSVACEGITGTEVASHVGDWQCMAILLQGDGSGAADRYQPRYIGMTGSRPAAGDRGFPAYEFDDEELTVMKVAPWRTSGPGETAMPQTTLNGANLHPHVYVSRGSHSLYPVPGVHSVDPFPSTALPHDCGDADSSTLAGPPPTIPSGLGPDKGSAEGFFAGLAAFLAKILAGARAGAVAGPIGATAGGFAGMYSGALEWIDAASSPFGSDGDTPDTPRPDDAPTAGTGTTIKPATVSASGVTVVNWHVGRRVPIGARTYDYVVDRETQVWWPHDDNERGYRGRWGQRVTNDTLPRRSGPLFPNHARMFLMALADLSAK